MILSTGKRQLAFSAAVAFLVAGGLSTDWANQVIAGCPGFTLSLCPSTTVVPCKGGTCVRWGMAFPGVPTPLCSAPSTYANHVTITVTATSWKSCGRTSDDTGQCSEIAATCATYLLYSESECDGVCPQGYSTSYCRYWQSVNCGS
jgi:hypothetical protein